jgi:hypothetical protein
MLDLLVINSLEASCWKDEPGMSVISSILICSVKNFCNVLL